MGEERESGADGRRKSVTIKWERPRKGEPRKEKNAKYRIEEARQN